MQSMQFRLALKEGRALKAQQDMSSGGMGGGGFGGRGPQGARGGGRGAGGGSYAAQARARAGMKP